MLQWLVGTFGLTLADLHADCDRLLRAACKNGHLQVAEWLVRVYQVAKYPASTIEHALIYACTYGHLDVAEWLHETFNVTPKMARAGSNRALLAACGAGHLNVARWLADTFGLTAADACAEDNEALRDACGNGHLRVAQWLTKCFDLGVADARAADNYALSVACEWGHLDVAVWLVREFGLTAADAHADGHFALMAAARSGRIAVVQWLVMAFPPGSPAIMSAHSAAYSAAEHATVRWLGLQAVSDDNFVKIRDRDYFCVYAQFENLAAPVYTRWGAQRAQRAQRARRGPGSSCSAPLAQRWRSLRLTGRPSLRLPRPAP
jgi:hypothetical protein